MKRRFLTTFLFLVFFINFLSIPVLKVQASATDMETAVLNVKNMTDYILKWEEEYIGYRELFERDGTYQREEFANALADFVSNFQATANEVEQKYYSKYLTDDTHKEMYEGMWQKKFFEACRDTSFIISVLDDYTEYITSLQTWDEGYTPLYIQDVGINGDESDYEEHYVCTIFAYISDDAVSADDVFLRLYYSACYHNPTSNNSTKDEDYDLLKYEYTLAPDAINSFFLVEGTHDGVNPRLLALEKTMFTKWGIKDDNMASVGNVILNGIPIDDITESIIQSIAGMIASFSIDVLSSASEQLLDLGPNLDLFMHYFGKDVGNTLPDGKTLIDLNSMFLIIGYVITTGLFLFFLIMCSINPSGDKNSVLQLIIAYPLILVGIYFSDDVVNVIYDLALSAWDSIFTSSMLETSTLPYLMAYLVTIEYLDVVWSLHYLGTLFNVAVGWIIIKNALTMFIEVIERYVISCLLYFGFGTSLSTLISPTTRPIFFAYIKMIISQLLLLFLNIYFIKGFFLLLVNYTSWSNSIYGIIFVIAYLKTAQKIDAHLHSLGLNVAQTGSSLASSVMGIGATMLGGAFATMKLAQTAGRLGKKVGRAGVVGAGIGLEASAIKKNDVGMFAKSQKMKEGSFLGGILSSPTSQTAQNLAYASAKKNPTSASTFKNALSDAKTGGIVNSALGGNATASIKANLGNMAKGNLGNITNAQFGAQGGGASFSSKGTSIGGKSHDITGTLSQSSANGGRYIGTAGDGTAMYAKINSKPSAQPGDSFAISVQKDQNGFAMSSAEMMTGVDFSKVPGLQERLANCEGATLHCQTGKHGNIYTITDDNNNLIGGFDTRDNYYSGDRDINISEKDFEKDGRYGAYGFEDVWCYSSELDSQINENALSPEDLNERINASIDDLKEKISDSKEELNSTIRDIADMQDLIKINESNADFDKDDVTNRLHDLQAKESSLRESIATDTDYLNSVSSFKDSLDELAESGYKDTFCGVRNGQIELYKMENVTISDVAIGDTKNSTSSNVRMIPLGKTDRSKLGF